MKTYTKVLKATAEAKAKDYLALIHEIRRLEMKAARLDNYINAMNDFIKTHGGEPVEFEASQIK